MKYKEVVVGTFMDRPNRFIAHVKVDHEVETVHVKNTGRCRELLLPGVAVVLARGENPDRKTKYDLVCVKKDQVGWINIDSQAPNVVMKEWLETQEFDLIRPEYTYGESRVDFYMEKGERRFLWEVKGCTLEREGQGYFPDAPTKRGVKHIYELIRAKQEGYEVSLVFVIQINGILSVLPNQATDPEFAQAFETAREAGVVIRFMLCDVSKDELRIVKECLL